MPFKDPEKRREMQRIYLARYAATDKGKEARRRAAKKWRETHPEAVQQHGREKNRRRYWRLKELGGSVPPRGTPDQIKAWSAVWHAVHDGRLTAQPCADCGAERTHAHHHNGYDKSHRLDVVWLCSKHHAAAHRAKRENAA